MQRMPAPIAAAAAILVVCSCGGSSPTSPSADNPITITITRQNGAQSFTPNPASAGGRRVVFRNADSVVHRVRLNDGTIDTGNIVPGASSSEVSMPDGGTNYHCELHPDMIGAISGTAGAPPPCDGPYCGGQ